jgi:flagellin glycosyltransferase Maf-like protein/6-hydroxymethylpterin diphosphokinase MptE-like protein
MSEGPEGQPSDSQGFALSRMQALHAHNMAVFEACAPDLFQSLDGLSPVEVTLNVDQNGIVNLSNRGQLVYPGDPRACIQEQAQHFSSDPSFIRGTPEPVHEVGAKSLPHPTRMIEEILKEPMGEIGPLPSQVRCLLVFGVGLGYHLEWLLENHDVRHLCVVEPQLDVLLASTYTMDWLSIFERFQAPGYTLHISAGKNRDECSIDLFNWVEEIGTHNAVVSFIYTHLETASIRDIREVFGQRVLATRFESGGSFEDERVGLAHTLHNYRAGVPLMRPAQDESEGPGCPAVLIANGPSLDHALDFLREARQSTILFTCGTAIGSMARAGIKPHFHIEQERPRSMAEWIAHASDDEDRAGVTVLALNTTHPEVFAQFERGGMGLKFRDAGTSFLEHTGASGDDAVQLTECNPTVLNAAFSFVRELGFTEVYLVGADLGFPAGDKHHSELSLYYDLKEGAEETVYVQTRPEEALVVPGNFGGEVETVSAFLRSRESLEFALTRSPGLQCYNTSEGVLIRGTEPRRIADIALGGAGERATAKATTAAPTTAAPTTIDTAAIASALFNNHFPEQPLHGSIDEDMVAMADRLRWALAQVRELADSPVESPTQAFALLDALHGAAKEIGNDERGAVIDVLFTSGIRLHGSILAQSLVRTNHEACSVELFHRCREHFVAFLDEVAAMDIEELYRPDMALDGLATKLKGTADPMSGVGPGPLPLPAINRIQRPRAVVLDAGSSEEPRAKIG